MDDMKVEGKNWLQVHVRWMTRWDMPEVLAIEAEAFDFPWSKGEFVRVLRQRNAVGMVAEHDDRVVGFMVYELNKISIHVLNFAVSRGSRARGVGSQMVRELLGRLSTRQRYKISLEVREGNLVAQRFWHAMGFRAWPILRGHYEDSDEDAYVFTYRLSAQERATAR